MRKEMNKEEKENSRKNDKKGKRIGRENNKTHRVGSHFRVISMHVRIYFRKSPPPGTYLNTDLDPKASVIPVPKPHVEPG